jgi:drug/metabolite transporter (DMT)-like permease
MTETPVDKPLRIFFSITGSIVLFGVMNMLAKLASESLPVPQIMFFRNLFGLGPVLFLIWRNGGASLFRTQRHSGHFIRSFIGFFSMCCFFWSFALLPLANATSIHFASPLVMTALSVLLLDEKVGRHRWTAILIGLGAVLFMLQPAGNGNMLGSLVAMNAAILGAFAMIAVRKLGTTEHALTIVFYFTVYCSLFSFVWMLFVWEMPTWRTALYLLAIGILGGFGQTCLTYAYARAPAGFVSSFSYFSIVVAATLDFIVWHHVLGWQMWVGSSIVIASGLYIVWRETRKHYRPTAADAPDSTLSTAPTEKDRLDETPQN